MRSLTMAARSVDKEKWGGGGVSSWTLTVAARSVEKEVGGVILDFDKSNHWMGGGGLGGGHPAHFDNYNQV